MKIDESEWQEVYQLRDSLDDEDRKVLRKLIKYAEYLEQTMTKAVDVLQTATRDSAKKSSKLRD